MDHVIPIFNAIATAAMETLTAADRERLLHGFNWIDEETFELPSDLTCVQYVLKAHETAKLMALCHDCHLENARERRQPCPK